MTRPLSVLSHSWAQREVGTGQSERAPCCLATGSWLGACLPHSPGIEPYLSPVWLHRLLALSGFPSRQALGAKERQASRDPEGRQLQLTAASSTTWESPSDNHPAKVSTVVPWYPREPGSRTGQNILRCLNPHLTRRRICIESRRVLLYTLNPLQMIYNT